MGMHRVTLLLSLLIIELGLTNAYERCGSANNGKSCSPGTCCSKHGYCGKTEDQCLDGCQVKFGTCSMATTKVSATTKTNNKTEAKATTKVKESRPQTQHPALPISEDGSCGPTKRCRDAHCCSKFGFCGNSPAHCGDGCQEKYGTCSIVVPPTLPSPNEPLTMGPNPVLNMTLKPDASLPISTDGSCGNGLRCPDGTCCSRFGFCGISNTHCVVGCQPEFGVCRVLTTPPPSYCGVQHENRSCPTGLCCGPDGVCGTGDAFCAALACQTKFGGCNFQPLPPVTAREFNPIYSPYVLVETAFTNYAVVAKKYAIRWLTMAFVISNDGVPFWGYSWRADGTDPDDKVGKQIAAMKKIGIDAIGSFGGAAGDELATVIKNDESLLKAYQSVVSAYKFQFIDFDIEGSSLADVATNQRRNRVLAHLQHANPDMLLSFTLPVFTTGLTEIGLNMLKDADAAGVRIDAVNVMAMDYGTGVTDMGKGAIDAIVNTQAQLKTLGLNSCVGVIPMIGVNDVKVEVFRQVDAHNLVNFVKDPKNNVCLTSFWSLDRDRSSATQIPQTDFEFTKILAESYALAPHNTTF